MINSNLYKETLLQPVLEGADELYIVSGFATSAMAFHHLLEITNMNPKINVSILVGMVASDGISISNHKGFQSIMNFDFKNSFTCSYIHEIPPVHSKLYVWKKEKEIFKSFIGSANYSQNAFLKKTIPNQREILSKISDSDVIDYYYQLEKESIYCNHSEIEQYITVYSDRRYYKKHTFEEKITSSNNNQITDKEDFVKVPLYSLRTNEVQTKGGLNWGQREGREPNQAYIQLTPEIYNSNFFPPRPQHFTVVTDDSKVLICSRAQKSETGQAIETPHNNSLLGEYFRNRLNLPNGAFITKEHLERYGRLDVTFYKIDDENYLLDFSKNDDYFYG